MADSYQQQTLIKICVRHHATHTGADFKQPVLFVRAFVFLCLITLEEVSYFVMSLTLN